MTIQTVGIIGFGRFGKLLAASLQHDVRVCVYDAVVDVNDSVNAQIRATSLQQTLETDCVILCVPILHFSSAVQAIAPLLPPHASVMDVCSVKLYPERQMRDGLPAGTRILPTHPMFGPVSARKGWANLPFVLCPDDQATPEEQALMRFWSDYIEQRHAARVFTMSADEHDRITAYNLCLTQLLGRVLGNIGIQPSPIDAQSFKHLLQMKEMSYSDSMELLVGMHRFNPYSREMRERLKRELALVEDVLQETWIPDTTALRQ
jgi:prephenate dehydrogenase